MQRLKESNRVCLQLPGVVGDHERVCDLEDLEQCLLHHAALVDGRAENIL